jgi:hypothetical protein
MAQLHLGAIMYYCNGYCWVVIVANHDALN